MRNIFKNRNLYLLGLIFIVALFTFFNLPRTFYQQDEWQTLGHNLAGGMGIFASANPLSLLFGEQTPSVGLLAQRKVFLEY